MMINSEARKVLPAIAEYTWRRQRIPVNRRVSRVPTNPPRQSRLLGHLLAVVASNFGFSIDIPCFVLLDDSIRGMAFRELWTTHDGSVNRP